MKTILHRTLAVALALGPAAAFAAPNPYGLNVAWTQCWGDGGTSNRLFACNTNSGAELLNPSFEVDAPLDNVCGMEMYLQLASESATLPLWWSMFNTGTCRPTALALVIQPPDPASAQCLDWGASLFGAAGIGNYVIGAAGPNTVTTAAVAAVPTGLGLSLTRASSTSPAPTGSVTRRRPERAPVAAARSPSASSARSSGSSPTLPPARLASSPRRRTRRTARAPRGRAGSS